MNAGAASEEPKVKNPGVAAGVHLEVAKASRQPNVHGHTPCTNRVDVHGLVDSVRPRSSARDRRLKRGVQRLRELLRLVHPDRVTGVLNRVEARIGHGCDQPRP